MKMILKNAKINNTLKNIYIDNGIIIDVTEAKEDVGIDLNGYSIYPGLIDIHNHGSIGFDVMDCNLEEISIYLAKNGVTSWLPTTVTLDIDSIKKVTETNTNVKGANILGFHLEGPYISYKYKGALNENYIKKPDIDEFNKINNVSLITMAPELEGSIEFIENCNAVVSLGHTDCDYDIAINAINAGAKCLTHTFNAMPPLLHRAPSIIGAAVEKNIYAQIICDGVHIHKAAIIAAYKMFGNERMILISDSIQAAGMSDAVYEFGGKIVTVKDGIAKLSDGTISGSTSNLFKCVKKAIEFGIPQDEAFRMATRTPAELLGVNKGIIEKGYDADLIVVDNELNIVYTIIGGEILQFWGVKKCLLIKRAPFLCTSS